MTQSEPLIQIVDEDDQVIGALPKPEALSQGKIHRISRVMLENNKGQVLLQRRGPNVPFPNTWDNSAAGHVDKSEDYISAAKREMAEEIGVEGVVLAEIAYYYSAEQNNGRVLKRFNRLYRGHINFTPENFDKHEVVAVKWFDIDYLKSSIKSNPEDFATGLIELIGKYY